LQLRSPCQNHRLSVKVIARAFLIGSHQSELANPENWNIQCH
jgi:hypothetical protein